MSESIIKNENQPEQKKSKQEQLKLISQGTYGCVFKNNDNNEKKLLKSQEEETLIKIQKKEKTSENEKMIGKKIIVIKNYKEYFAPILENSDVNIYLLDEDEMEKCNFINNEQDPNTKYESEKINYIGKYTIIGYYLKNISNEKNFISSFIENHIILLEALEKLESAKIIHYDLKENNIMIHDKEHRPIIIDFGLSIDTTIPMEKYFFRYYTDYAPWCIDIIFLSYMVNQLGKDWKTKTIESNEIMKIIDEYFEKNPGVLELFKKDEQNRWKTNMLTYFNQYTNKQWQLLYEELIKYCFTWDNYSISIMYLYMMNELELTKYTDNISCINDYIELLKEDIMKNPNKRSAPDQMKKYIFKTFRSVDRTNLKNMKENLKRQYSENSIIQNIEKKVALSTLTDYEREKIIYNKISV